MTEECDKDRIFGDIPQKWVECDDCGHVNQQSKMFPLSLSCCKTCGSLHIRIHRTPEEQKALWARQRAKRRKREQGS